MPEYDLSKLLADKSLTDTDLGPLMTDRSGRPAPQGVVAVLKSGLSVPCSVRYDGMDADRTRRYAIIAECDWSHNPITTLIIDVLPKDVTPVIHVPNLPDDAAHRQYAYDVTVEIRKWVD